MVALGDHRTQQKTWLDGQYIRQTQDMVFQHFKLTKLYPDKACSAIAGYRVYTRPQRQFEVLPGMQAYGVTYCSFGSMQIGTNQNLPRQRRTVAHQIFHAIQGCQAFGEIDEGLDRMHANWNRLGINDVLDKIQEGGR